MPRFSVLVIKPSKVCKKFQTIFVTNFSTLHLEPIFSPILWLDISVFFFFFTLYLHSYKMLKWRITFIYIRKTKQNTIIMKLDEDVKSIKIKLTTRSLVYFVSKKFIYALQRSFSRLNSSKWAPKQHIKITLTIHI